MKEIEAQYASERLAQLKSEYQVDVLADWGKGDSSNGGSWQLGSWAGDELDRLHDWIAVLAESIGGKDRVCQFLGGVTVQKTDIGSHAGEALAHKVSFAKNGSISAWTVVHEFSHAWDANYNWKLSQLIEKYTGGFTSPFLSRIKRSLGLWDAGPQGKENKPGRNGRKPGCNAAGYFYGDKPGGSDWNFNRKEDFAEAVAMYVGWEKNNALSDHANKRIIRYEKLKNGEKDGFGVADNWEDYAKYFYPEAGDYAKTKRWQFVDDLVNGKLGIT